MGIVTLLALGVGGFLAGLVVVAALVAGWEWLRQRELLDSLRRDRAVYAATSPLPLPAERRHAGSEAATSPLRRHEGAAAPAGGSASFSSTPRGPSWIETRPTVLSFAPALDDETAARSREPDLRLD